MYRQQEEDDRRLWSSVPESIQPQSERQKFKKKHTLCHLQSDSLADLRYVFTVEQSVGGNAERLSWKRDNKVELFSFLLFPFPPKV